MREFGPPKKGYNEKIYWHDIEADKEGYSNVAIVNEGFENNKGIGIWLRFKRIPFPFLHNGSKWEWMNMYVQ